MNPEIHTPYDPTPTPEGLAAYGNELEAMEQRKAIEARINRPFDARRVLSIKQPWAWLIIRPDLTGEAREEWHASRKRKDIENRTWRTEYRGALWIHAGKSIDRAAREALPHMGLGDIVLPETFETGGIVGLVTLVGIHDWHNSPWFVGPIGWELADPTPQKFEPMKGSLGIFRAGDQRK